MPPDFDPDEPELPEWMAWVIPGVFLAAFTVWLYFKVHE